MSARLLLLIFFGCITQSIFSQSCFNIFAGNDTIIPCSQSCLTLKARIPDIQSTANYKVIPYNYDPFPYYISSGTTVTVTDDDIWSSPISLPFNFCFFGVNYNRLVVGANGILSFDLSNTGFCDFTIPNPLPSASYPRACIMGAYHDINPADPGGASPDRSMQYSVTGNAPCRKFILNFYKIPLYGDPPTPSTPRPPSLYCRRLLATHQIILYEGTGIIDINIQDKPSCPETNGGKAIVGIQNNAFPLIGIAPPNRNGGIWGSVRMNESWRFVPNGTNSLFKKVELFQGNTLIAVGDTLSLGTGELQATFNNICTTQDTSAYRVVATYVRCDDPNSLITAEDTIQVLRTAGPPVDATFSPASCASGGTGIITVSSPVGPDYEYSVDGVNYQTSPVFNLPAGTYTVQARSTLNGCKGSAAVTIPVIETIRFTVSATNATCNGAPNGQVLVIPQAGAAPFQFSSDGGATYQGSNLLLLPAGTYTIRVKDNNNCTKDTLITVNQPDSITISPLVNAAYCSGDPDGQIIVTASGGTPGYRYSLNNTTYQTSNTLSANVGTFMVYVRDNNGCVYSTSGVDVSLNDTMRLQPYPDTSLCIGSSLTITPATNATAFRWSPNTFINDTASARPVITPQDTTTYYLQARLGNLCSRVDTFTVNVLKRPIPNAGSDTIICFGTPAYFHATAVRGNKFRWIPAANLNSAFIPNPVVTGFIPINYVLEVTDPYGCGFKNYDTLQLTVRPKVRAFAGQDTTATLGTPIQLSGCCMNLYQWSPASLFVNDTARNPIGNFPPGTTQVVMITTTPEGCAGRDTMLVKGYEGPTYYVPSAFSPGNRDGRNDVFRPIPVGITETYYFSVFNRYGQILYTTKTFMQGWDGRWNGELQPEGAYIWMVRGKGINGKIVEKKGTVVLMR